MWTIWRVLWQNFSPLSLFWKNDLEISENCPKKVKKWKFKKKKKVPLDNSEIHIGFKFDPDRLKITPCTLMDRQTTDRRQTDRHFDPMSGLFLHFLHQLFQFCKPRASPWIIKILQIVSMSHANVPTLSGVISIDKWHQYEYHLLLFYR